jgi:tRNA (guanine-N7-)-methyltransferase
MRIRKKKHLDERIENVGDVLIVANRDVSNVNLAILDKKYLDYENIFGNSNPVCLEIGCGKGGFACKTAIKNPDVNILAVEMVKNVIVMACENAKQQNLPNLRFMNTGAEYLPRYIMQNSIDTLYLNFSPPFPGDAYENRRLTCDRRIVEYKDFLIEGGCVYQKTDDKEFFEYSFAQFVKHGFEVENVSSLIESGEIESVKTEYEMKFRSMGMPIYALKAKKV